MTLMKVKIQELASRYIQRTEHAFEELKTVQNWYNWMRTESRKSSKKLRDILRTQSITWRGKDLRQVWHLLPIARGFWMRCGY